MAKKTAAKKTASKKKRTAAQKRATAKMIAANKKRASKKKSSARKKRTTRTTPRRRPTTRLRGSGGARRTNPVSSRYVVYFANANTGRNEYVTGFTQDGGLLISDKKAEAALFTKSNAQSVAKAFYVTAEKADKSGFIQYDTYSGVQNQPY